MVYRLADSEYMESKDDDITKHFSFLKEHGLTIEHTKMMPLLYDVFTYSQFDPLFTTKFEDCESFKAIQDKEFKQEWNKCPYVQMCIAPQI